MAKPKLTEAERDQMVDDIYEGKTNVAVIPPALLALFVDMLIKFIMGLFSPKTPEEKAQRKKLKAVMEMARKQERANHKAGK